MQWLNYHHLYYFWLTATRGSISQASEELRLSPSTVSTQIKQLEEQLSTPLFARVGRRLVLTDTGRTVLRYADEIFALGRELQQVVGSGRVAAGARLHVGISDVIPKLIAYRLLNPALELDEDVRLVVEEDEPERLFSSLALHALDVVLHDAPLPPGTAIRAFSHLLGECAVTVFGTPAEARRYKRRFPHSLDGAPFLLPTRSAALRSALDGWFAANGLNPVVRAEVRDSALLKVLGQAGVGLFAAPSVIEGEIQSQYGVRAIGRLDGVRERYFAITVERRIKHPAVSAVAEAARGELFR